MSNSKRRYRRRRRQQVRIRVCVLQLPGQSPEQEIGDPLPAAARRVLGGFSFRLWSADPHEM